MVIHPKVRGFICTTAHPEGCAKNVQDQIRYVQSQGVRKDGPKRVLVIGGEAVPYSLARVPKKGETRGNLAVGGTGSARPLSARDREIAAALAPAFDAEGLLLVGLDVIGDYLTEVNVTSPTCFQEITEQTGFNVAGMMLDVLEKRFA